MKLNKLTISSALILSLGLMACVNDLNVTPIDPNVTTTGTAYSTVDSYKQGLAKLYASFTVSGQQGPSGQNDISGIDEGFGTYSRAYWNCQELATDEAVIGWNDQTVKNFHYQTWSASDVFITAMYSRAIYTVTLCNEFVRVTTDVTAADSEIKKFHAEARFLRALAYFHALDLFGNVPLITEKDPSTGKFYPKQAKRADLYAYIESELLAIENDLGEPRFEYARADKGACWMLLAKLYLNAKVYANVEKNTEAITYLNKLLAASYTLAPTYKENFTADNNASPEMIFPITCDGTYTRSYGGTTYLIHACLGGSMSEANFGVVGKWGGIRTTSAFSSKFTDLTGATDTRAMIWTNGQNENINDIGTFTDGYGITKFSNLKKDGSAADHHSDDFADTDFPMFRLADAYLMYAEAVVRGGSGGSLTDALDYVNALRKRAYGNDSGNITAPELTLDFILDERSRELYFEGHRRTDLIRYGKFTGSEYLWPWKGGVIAGTGTPDFRNIYPIPSNELGANPTLDQNDGY